MRGVVAAGHPLTAEAGADVLREGGNAVDAAVAAVLTSVVVEPMMTGLDGGGYLMVAPPGGDCGCVVPAVDECSPVAVRTAGTRRIVDQLVDERNESLAKASRRMVPLAIPMEVRHQDAAHGAATSW